MARLIDENFDEHGYADIWGEYIMAGCTLQEGVPVSSFTAGITAPSTWYGYGLLSRSDGDATPDAFIYRAFSANYNVIYARFNFILVSANFTDSAIFGLFAMVNSLDKNFNQARIKWIQATNTYGLEFVSYVTSSGTPQVVTVSITPYTTYNVEMYWNNTTNDVIHKVNDSVVATIIKSVSYAMEEIYVGQFTTSYTANATVYFDNIRVNDDTGDINNTWPGTSYDEPLRCIELLSTQRQIGLEL